MEHISRQYLSEAIILKLQQLQSLDTMLTAPVPASVTPISFNSIRQAYHEIIDSILQVDLPNYFDSAHECVILVCLEKCRDMSTADTTENWLNVHEDLLNRIRFGQHLNLYEYRSADRFDNMMAKMELEETKEDPEDVGTPLGAQMSDNMPNVFMFEPKGPELTMADLSTGYQGDEDAFITDDSYTLEDAIQYYENQGYESD